ncbi:MAG TPA: glycoside hydrolase family 2 TIM barrel-domain containing protein [Tepidisphaeraceae bacterium]|jgi:beta-galactosidase|nr:glycoside hydrolase family 2 TIM barrel-domain containing protein [Tepidisphaeraceae bacterium]
MHFRERFVSLRGVVALITLLASLSSARAAQDYVWIEGEQPTASNCKWNNAGSSHGDWLSGGKWLTVTLDGEKVEKEIPAEGAIFDYAFSIAEDGKHEVWARLGFEFARAPFDWKIDNGEWKSVSHDDLTSDAMELDFFGEAAWLKLADPQLGRGDHKLTIRLPRVKNKDGKFEGMLFGLDAVCVSAKPFFPHSRYKPDEAWRTEKDEQATKQIFTLPAPKVGGERASVELSGLWEVCRNDEQTPGEVAEPIKDFPEHPFWGAIAVPGDRNTLRPDLLFAHRLWYRTRVNVPQEQAGRSFVLTFPENNLNTTVYVNGVYCGFNKNPFARFDIDVTKGIKPGANEIWVGIRDAWYGRSADTARPMKLRRTFNLPEKFFNDGFQDMAYPVWSLPQSGILLPPVLTAAGKVYASDVFVKPSVARKQLAVEVTVSNPAATDVSGEVVLEAVDSKTGASVKKFKGEPFTVPAGKSQVVAVARDWTDAKLWWPDEPNLYVLRASLITGNETADVSDTAFGFREWTIDGIHFKLNGVNFHGWCDQHSHSSKEEWLAFQRKTNQQMMRFWGRRFYGLGADDALNFFDQNGVVVRRSGVLDGEAIGYFANEPDEVVRKRTGSEIKLDLLQNWRDQVVAQVKGERNHPSVMIWSIENEWLYINCINLYGGLMDAFEVEETKTADAVLAIDPTRPIMCDGGAACLKQTLPVCGNHYITGAMSEYPTLAYSANTKGGGRGRWEWDQKRPRLVGEDWFIAGNHPELATVGGEAALTGKSGSLPAAGRMTRILQEGYRWADYGGWDFWMNSTDADGSQYVAFSPRAVLCRDWNWTFASDSQVPRKLAIFNDTRSDAPITFRYEMKVSGNHLAGESKEYRVPPGGRENAEISLPAVHVETRTPAELTLTLEVGGKEVFRDAKQIAILPGAVLQARAAGLADGKKGDILVCDPAGLAADSLTRALVPFTKIDDLSALSTDARVLVVGKDVLDNRSRASSALAAWAAAGRTVIVLEQNKPLEFQAIPAEIETAANVGRVAFIEDASHPAFAGLADMDFFTWGEDEIVYRDAYAKPTRGAKSLLACDNELKNSALVEVPVEKGLLLLCQMSVEEKLQSSPAAQQLLTNLLSYGVHYKQSFRATTVTAAGGSSLAKVVDATGLSHTKVADAVEAIAQPGERVAVIEATPDNLKKLAASTDAVNAFTNAGGWIVFNGLTPEGLESYNKIVGWEHMIRPFKRELVTFPPVRSPLTAGIPAGDIAMYSSKRIFPWQEGSYVVSDEFSFVVDYDDVAPFAKSTFFAYDNIVNGFTNADGWPLIINWEIPKDGSLPTVPITLPKPQTITEFTWIGNTNYLPQKKVNLIFDGDKGHVAEFPVAPTGEAQTFRIDPPRSAREITLQIAEWQPMAGKGPLIGIDNIYLKAQRPPEFYAKVKPMLNVGGMMEYPRGKGGIVLCNLLFQDQEEVPANAVKKRSIFSTLLRNLKAPFAGGKSVIVGANVAYAPIDISKQANQFRTERGWFGDKSFTFADLPTGPQNFAGVPFNVYEFATSPVPTAIMLAGPGVPGSLPSEVKGIPVGKKADALFFLQAARIDKRRDEREKKENKKLGLARYVVHYADGRSADIPVYSEIDVDDYKQQDPQPLPGAQIAWTHKYEGTPFYAVAYTKQWNNPRAEVEIASVDLVIGADKSGVPALLALTAGSAK